jgi:transcription elongation GreA/GreB family factor
MTAIKEQLYQLCGEYINNREAEIKKVIAEAQDAAANETKSSAGDKYETGREVMQQEIDLNLGRLNELKKLRTVMEQILHTRSGDAVVPGAVVYTSNGNFYIAVSAGQLRVAGISYYAVSAASPIGQKMVGQKAGHAFELNGKSFTIKDIE